MSARLKQVEVLQGTLQELRDVLRIEVLQKDIQAGEEKMQASDFWNDSDAAQKISQETAEKRQEVERYQALETAIEDMIAIIELAESEDDQDVLSDIDAKIPQLEQRIHDLELMSYFTEEHDMNNALVSLHAGAGGTDAMDWTEMLTRMFIRYAEQHDWHVTILEESRGEEAGYKSVHLEIRGRRAYGYLRGEAGVHRLVRISPFDAENMRHTAFALVEVIPEIEMLNASDFEIDEKDLRIDTFMSSGKGGQSVNTTYSAVRITHLPTNTVVTCQNERSQQQNKETAMKVLKSRLFAQLQEEQKERIEELKGKRRSPEWGSQIRSYVLHPYTQVKDHRTGEVTQDVQRVLDGDLDAFSYAYLRDKARKP